jgi:EAL domain-containing protein (putative c-di-GMP-specific phosphodiesterase class I)
VAVSAGEANADDLLRQADVALTRAKDLGRDRIEVYRPELDRRVQLRIAMRDTLRTALSENRIEVHAQPVIDLASGRIVGAEALVRLRDLDGTLLPPAAFIPVAEESGLIVPLGLRVMDVALALRARWAEAGSPLEIAVNVSPRQLVDADFAATIATLLQAHGVPSDQLVLEVTESTVVDAVSPTLDMLGTLRDAGVHVAIDDFGTGYSSLTSLRDLPADVVKIDRTFVSGLLDDESDEAIVRAVLAMAHATHRTVVAEGVETAEQAARLRALGCDRVQGFHYAPPLSPVDFDPTRAYPVVDSVPAPRLQG